MNPTGFVTEVFDFKVPMTPLVVLPLLALGTVFLAYLASFIILRVVRGTAKRVSLTLDGRVLWLLDHYLFPLLIVVGLWWLLDVAPLPPKVARAADRMLSLTGLVIAIIVVVKSILVILRNIAARYQPLARLYHPGVANLHLNQCWRGGEPFNNV